MGVETQDRVMKVWKHSGTLPGNTDFLSGCYLCTPDCGISDKYTNLPLILKVMRFFTCILFDLAPPPNTGPQGLRKLL